MPDPASTVNFWGAVAASVVALLGAGGAAVKLIDRLFSNRKATVSLDAKLRSDLVQYQADAAKRHESELAEVRDELWTEIGRLRQRLEEQDTKHDNEMRRLETHHGVEMQAMRTKADDTERELRGEIRRLVDELGQRQNRLFDLMSELSAEKTKGAALAIENVELKRRISAVEDEIRALRAQIAFYQREEHHRE